MKELIISEFLRMKGRKKNKKCFILIFITFILSIAWLKTIGGQWGFYTPHISTKINSLNLNVFVMKDLIAILFFIVLPMLFTDSLSGEYESGAYRLILIRPYNKIQLWASKLIVQSLFSLAIFIVFFILSEIAGIILFNKVNYTTFYNTPKIYDKFGAFIYNFKVVILIYLVSIAILALSSLISAVICKSVLSFFMIICFLMASIYIGHGFQVICLPFNNIVRLLSLKERANFYIPIVAYLVLCGVLSTFIFIRKDLKN